MSTWKVINSLVLLFPFFTGTSVGVAAGNAEWSAALRENFVTQYEDTFGGDGAGRVKWSVFDTGFKGTTLHIKFAVQDTNPSYIYAPPSRTPMSGIETFIAKIHHSHGWITLKPYITKHLGLGVADKAIFYSPPDVRTWFTTYQASLLPYLVAAKKRQVHEFVLATGLFGIKPTAYASQWVQLATYAKTRLTDSVILSFEISNETDLDLFESWSEQNPTSFAQFSNAINRIRVSYHPDLKITASRLTRAERLFPGRVKTLANVVFAACQEPRIEDGETFCPAGEPNDAQKQVTVATHFLTQFSSNRSTVFSSIQQIELLYATTTYEMDFEQADARMPFYNANVRQLLQKQMPKPVSPDAKAFRDPGSVLIQSTDVGTSKKKVACVYFDEKDENDHVGPIQSRMLESLLGAFPSWNVRRSPVSSYQAGDAVRCDAIFYLAVNFFVKPSPVFYQDVAAATQSKPVVWINYKLSDFAKVVPKLGFNVKFLLQPVRTPSPTQTDPGFYRFFTYKGETFEKLSIWHPILNRFAASPELNDVHIQNASAVKVLAQAEHSDDRSSKKPYAVVQAMANGSVWYIADSPFSMIHYEDRYLIFCDLLWDILKETPPTGPQKALVRLEDMNPHQEGGDLSWTFRYLRGRGVPFGMAVIPFLSDVYATNGNSDAERMARWEPITEHPEFIGLLRYGKAMGGSVIWHGVAHQAGDSLGGFDGISGSDYEFWLYPGDKPLPYDSSDFVLNLLDKGAAVFDKAGLKPIAWEAPHYAASALDYSIFGRAFRWNYHRPIYFKFKLDQDAPALTSAELYFACGDASCRESRKEKLRQLRLTADYSQLGGQVIPYPVYKDSYGQSIIPETLGATNYIFYDKQNRWGVQRPDDLLRIAKKLKVIRGAVASFFWHADLMNPKSRYYERYPGTFESEGGAQTLTRVVEGLQEMGYQFVSVEDLINARSPSQNSEL